MTQVAEPGTRVGTVNRVIGLFNALAESRGEIALSTLADQLELPRPSVHRILESFRAAGLVVSSPETKRYDIGPALYRLAGLIMNRQDLRALAHPTLEAVVRETGEKCVLGVYLPGPAGVMFVDEVRSASAIFYQTPLFEQTSLVWTAAGHCILAWLPPEIVDRILAVEPVSPTGVALDPGALKAELEKVRRRGYLESAGLQVSGAGIVAAPIFGHTGGVVATLAIVYPWIRQWKEHDPSLGPLLVARADEISRLLGADRGG
jgi:DNA-binding IclR family transcriptional regulator